MASKIKNLEILNNVFGDGIQTILNLLERENIKISKRSTNFVLNISNLIFNYIDFVHNGNVSIVKNKTLAEIENEYSHWYSSNKNNFVIDDKLDILYDYRENDVGYFWANLHTHCSSEMMFNMGNCGRVGVNQNLIVLIEQLINGTFEMRAAIVMSNDHYITQIKGKSNEKPVTYYTQIFDFFLKYEPILGFKRIFKPENDFTISDLNIRDSQKLKSIKPHLFNKFI